MFYGHPNKFSPPRVGRLVTPNLCHGPIDRRVDPFDEPVAASGDDPFESNQEIASPLFGHYRQRLAETMREFDILTLQRFSFFAYPLSAVRPLLKVEDRLETLLGSLMTFRLLAVLERQ